MRILFCNYEYPPLGGGAGVMNALLAEELAKRHEVTVLTSQALGLPRESVEAGVRVIRVPVFFRRKFPVANFPSLAAFIPMGIHRGKHLMRDHRFDIINTHFALPTGPVGDALARASGLPNILTVHGGDLYDPSKLTSPHRHPLLRAWVRHLLRRADVIVGQSRNTLENVGRFYDPLLAPVRIHALIRRPEALDVARDRYGLHPEDVVMVTVGRLVARKAVHQLLSLLQAFRNEPVRLLVIGSGPQDAALKEEARRLGVADRVRFLGQVEEREKCGILRLCDLYVSTSQHEGFGLVFVEGMAAGLPVVCYDHGGQMDFLESGRTGYVVPLNDLKAFEQRCRELIGDPALRRRMGEDNRRLAEPMFADQCAKQYEALFERVIASHRNGNGGAS